MSCILFRSYNHINYNRNENSYAYALHYSIIPQIILHNFSLKVLRNKKENAISSLLKNNSARAATFNTPGALSAKRAL